MLKSLSTGTWTVPLDATNDAGWRDDRCIPTFCPCAGVIQSSGPLRHGIVDGLDVREARVHNFPPQWNAAPSPSRVPIIPLRIHWLDALTPPLENHLLQLAEVVKALLQTDVAHTTASLRGSGGEASTTVHNAHVPCRAFEVLPG
jgi:hypothetical protein